MRLRQDPVSWEATLPGTSSSTSIPALALAEKSFTSGECTEVYDWNLPVFALGRAETPIDLTEGQRNVCSVSRLVPR